MTAPNPASHRTSNDVTTFVISDVHLGPNTPLTTFRESERLSRFIRQLAASDSPTELVMGGDVFDFLLQEDALDFSPENGLQHMSAIFDHQRIVFDALKVFCENHRLVILSGNHDPNLLYPQIRACIEQRVAANGASVHWADDDPPLLPAKDHHHYEVTGYKPRTRTSDGREIWIVHGDIWDAENAIDRPAFREAITTGEKIRPCAGSTIVARVLNRLKARRPWIDTLKPEIGVVVPLLMYLEPRQLFEIAKSKTSPDVISSMVLGRLRTVSLGDDEVSTQSESGDPVAAAIAVITAECLSSCSEREKQSLGIEFADYLRHGRERYAGSLSSHDGIRSAILRWVIERGRTPDWGVESSLLSGLDFYGKNLGVLVSGHTHRALIDTSTDVWHYNTGTWLPLASFPDGDVESAIDAIDRNELHTMTRCTCVRIDGSGVQLCEVDESGSVSPVVGT